MIENVGKVELQLDYYLGKDLYSDGEVEDELLEIVKNNSEKDYYQIVMDNPKWAYIYHLLKERENIIRWFPFEKNADVLEIGAGCGAVTGCLCENAKSVTGIELSKKRSLINAYRHKECGNLKILVANFKDVYDKLNKKFDYITLIGVLEYARSYMSGKKSFEMLLECINTLLNENGKLIIAIENRFGLKYFAGCKEDHLGKAFVGLEGYDNDNLGVKTFNKPELENLLKSVGYINYKFYYPYPDYKFADVIYSDSFLPREGELINNIRNFDANRLVLFDELKAFNGIIDSELFPQFANSFLVVIDKKG